MANFIEHPYAELIKIPESGGIYELIKNHYWLRNAKGNVLFFGKLFASPQCNSNKMIVERVLAHNHADCEIVFVENAWVKVDIRDYV